VITEDTEVLAVNRQNLTKKMENLESGPEIEKDCFSIWNR
jgi:hypothetical protein